MARPRLPPWGGLVMSAPRIDPFFLRSLAASMRRKIWGWNARQRLTNRRGFRYSCRWVVCSRRTLGQVPCRDGEFSSPMVDVFCWISELACIPPSRCCDHRGLLTKYLIVSCYPVKLRLIAVLWHNQCHTAMHSYHQYFLAGFWEGDCWGSKWRTEKWQPYEAFLGAGSL